MHRQHAGAPNPIEGAKLPGFEDHFQMGIATSFLDGCDFIEYESVLALQERATRYHHVDFVGALFHSDASFFQLDLSRRHAARKRRCHGSDTDVCVPERAFRSADHRGIDTNGGNMRQIGQRVMEVHRFLAKLADFAGRILSFERRQVDHRQHHMQRFDLRSFLDAAGLKTGSALGDANLIDEWHLAHVRHGRGNR